MFNQLKKFRKNQDGNATIEFVFLFPIIIFLFLMGFESSYYMVRNVMLERAVNVAVRDVRLSDGNMPSFNTFRQNICDQAAILPDCMNSLQVEMEQIPIAVGGVDAVKGSIKCINKNAADYQDGVNFDMGTQNTMMVIKVCALSEPLFPSTGLGVRMQRFGQGKYAIVTTAAFVTEPGDRSMEDTSGGISAGG
ncbi:MAG: pilus assembly protein [Boseongicola sp.]|nr:pilus assembly protein [Boseongicola sp.]MDD9977046.1 pilus assembly protein [Boseongicola sp.]